MGSMPRCDTMTYAHTAVDNRDLNRFMEIRDAEVEALRARVKQLEVALDQAKHHVYCLEFELGRQR